MIQTYYSDKADNLLDENFFEKNEFIQMKLGEVTLNQMINFSLSRQEYKNLSELARSSYYQRFEKMKIVNIAKQLKFLIDYGK